MADSKRAIFEEVSGDKPAPKSTPPRPTQTHENWRVPMRIWFITLAILVIIMIAVGGLTRQTDSGLSITEWQLIKGTLPPLSAEDWQTAMQKYRTTDEYKLQNKGMTLAEFKTIFWWEWGHRQLGRFIGLVWAVGFIIFALMRQKPPRPWLRRALIVGGLGGAQGAIGWWMVSSGLRGGLVDVASYRLAIHLGLAFIILSVLAWFIWMLGQSSTDLFAARRRKDAGMLAWGRGLWAVCFAQIILGALVAGIDAGLIYNDWPMMNGTFFPSDSGLTSPAWRNVFENHGLVQFNHRIMGYALFVLAFIVWMRGRAAAYRPLRGLFGLVFIAIIGQMILGISTLVSGVPTGLSLMHQMGAIVVLLLILRGCFIAYYPMKGVLR